MYAIKQVKKSSKSWTETSPRGLTEAIALRDCFDIHKETDLGKWKRKGKSLRLI